MTREARALGAEAERLLQELARFSEPGPGVTRLYLSPEHAAAIRWLEREMQASGLATRLDAAATLIGRAEGGPPGAPALLLGSHIDSVREAGRYDGCLGVVLALVALRALARAGGSLPCPVELLAFGDEEGVRFPATLTGSRAIAGLVPADALEMRDGGGVSLRRALEAFGCDPAALHSGARDPGELAGYVEVHIEQGPVLERRELPLGIVTAIADAARFAVTFTGHPGHAGTVPMGARRDALAAAAEAILAVERIGTRHAPAVATVGRIEAEPGAVNVIPGIARLTLDLRAPGAAALASMIREIVRAIEGIAAARGVETELRPTHAAPGCSMDPGLMARLKRAVESLGIPPYHLPSGAGHDAMIMAGITPTAMLFVRCRHGLSHHPDEHASIEDMGLAASALVRLIADGTGPDATPGRR